MWVFQLIENSDIIEFDIQILIHALQSTANGDVIFEFNSDRVIHKGFEEAEEQHCNLRELWWRFVTETLVASLGYLQNTVERRVGSYLSMCGKPGSRAAKARSQSSLSLPFSKNPSVTQPSR